MRTKDVVYAYEDMKLTDCRTVSLKSYYYVMNNLFRETINPKVGDSIQLNKYTQNLLSRMAPISEAFSASRFNWIELSTSLYDARNRLPYAPYVR